MNTRNDHTPISNNKIREKIEDYTTTIQALQSFVSLLSWDNTESQPIKKCIHCFGRKMETSETNVISPSIEVTPDVVIQRDSSLGFVVEAKKTLPNEQEYWKKVVEQLKKYDDELSGWWTDNEKINTICIVLLLEISRSADFKKYFLMLKEEGTYVFRNPFSIIEFTRAPEIKEYFFIRKHWGDIQDGEISGILDSGKKIPIEEVVANYGEIKFYDSQPVTEHTMVVLWNDIFNDMKTNADYDEENKAWVFKIKLDEITLDLQRLYGSATNKPREVSFPRTKWVRDALDSFVKLDFAKTTKNENEYKIYFKRIRGELIEKFSEHRKLKKRKNGEDKFNQLNLFPPK